MMGYGPYGYGGGYGMMSGWGFFIGVTFWLLMLAGLVLLVVWAVRTMSHGGGGGGAGKPPADEACTIARTRYAKGEITKEQYEEICRTLGV